MCVLVLKTVYFKTSLENINMNTSTFLIPILLFIINGYLYNYDRFYVFKIK